MVLMAIARVYDSNYIRQGYRLLDILSYKTLDVADREIYNAIVTRKVTVNNLEIENGNLVVIERKSGSLPDVLGADLLKDDTYLTIIAKLGDIGFEVSDHNGKIEKMGLLEAYSYGKNFGFTNITIGCRKGNFYIRENDCDIVDKGYTKQDIECFNKRVELINNKNKTLKMLGYPYTIDLDFSPIFSDSVPDELNLIAPISRLNKKDANKLRYVKKIRLPGTLYRIPDKLFYNSRLTYLEIEDGVQEIGQSAFSYSTMLTEVKLPSTLKIIEKEAFYKCNIKEVELPHCLEFIGRGAFIGNSFKNIDIPDSVKFIRDLSFYNCKIDNLHLGKGIEYIGNKAFAENNIKVLKKPNNVKSIGNNAFDKKVKFI